MADAPCHRGFDPGAPDDRRFAAGHGAAPGRAGPASAAVTGDHDVRGGTEERADGAQSFAAGDARRAVGPGAGHPTDAAGSDAAAAGAPATGAGSHTAGAHAAGAHAGVTSPDAAGAA